MKYGNFMIMVTAAAALGGAVWAFASNPPACLAGGMDGMKMGPMPQHLAMGGVLIGYRQAQKIVKVANREGKVGGSKKHPLVVFHGKRVHIRMIAVEPGASDQTFEIHKRVDPAISVKAGATIDLTLLNMDYGLGMIHGVVIGKIKPPFPMVIILPVKHQLVSLPMMMPRSRKSIHKSSYYAESARFKAPKTPGVYYYFCQMPMHAKQGMYGKFMVRK